nr:hypothetical protein [Tanacetum cinerariifolium]
MKEAKSFWSELGASSNSSASLITGSSSGPVRFITAVTGTTAAPLPVPELLVVCKMGASEVAVDKLDVSRLLGLSRVIKGESEAGTGLRRSAHVNRQVIDGAAHGGRARGVGRAKIQVV